MKKRALYVMNVSPENWEVEDPNGPWETFKKPFVANEIQNIFMPRLRAYAESVGADFIEWKDLKYDAEYIKDRTWYYRAVNTMKIYALRDAVEKGYEEFLLLDHDVLITKYTKNIFEEVTGDGFYMYPASTPNQEYKRIQEKYFDFKPEKTYNGGVVFARGEPMKQLADFTPFSLYAFFDRMVWTKMPIEKFIEENIDIRNYRGNASSDEVVYPYLAFESGVGIKELDREWNFTITKYQIENWAQLEEWGRLEKQSFIHFMSDGKDLFKNEGFAEKLISNY